MSPFSSCCDEMCAISKKPGNNPGKKLTSVILTIQDAEIRRIMVRMKSAQEK
jgi:hypothetical protein